MALFVFETIVNFFIHCFANLSVAVPAKACQALNLYFRQFNHVWQFALIDSREDVSATRNALGRGFFHPATRMTDKTPSFRQSLDKMKSRLLV